MRRPGRSGRSAKFAPPAGRRHTERGDAAITIVEMMVAMVISSLVVLAITAALITGQRAERLGAADSETLGDLRHAMDMVTTDLRQARRVFSDSSSTMVHMWIDEDRDYVEDTAEKITWEIVTVGGITRLQRRNDADSTPVVAADHLVSGGSSFTYKPSVADPTVIGVRLEADADVGSGLGSRVLETEVRLRNADTD